MSNLRDINARLREIQKLSFFQLFNCCNLLQREWLTWFIIIIFFSVSNAAGQTGDWYPYGGLANACEYPVLGWTRYDGRVGIRIPLNNVFQPYLPAEALHIHSGMCYSVAEPQLYLRPAVVRIQSEALDDLLGKSEIQFWSGKYTAGSNGPGTDQDWLVSSIKPISKIAGPFNTAVNTGNWFGGMAFYCSGILPRPQHTSEIEVMRLYDRRVAINSQTALGVFDVVTRPDIFPNRISFSDGNDNVCNSGPHIKMYRLAGNPPYVELGAAYPLWMSYETQAPPELGYAQFQIRGRASGTPILGTETPESMKPLFTLLTKNGNVGLNEPNPDARLQVKDGSVVFLGEIGDTPRKWTSTQTADPDDNPCFLDWTAEELGAGTRLMWIPSKAAFRVGYVASSQWNSQNIGPYSVAMGSNNIAMFENDVSIGQSNTSNSKKVFEIYPEADWTRHGAITIGHDNGSYGIDGVSIGYANFVHSLAGHSVAIGAQNQVMGIPYIYSNTTPGDVDDLTQWHAFAFGYKNKANTHHSMGIGYNSVASRKNTIAICSGSELINNIENSLMLGADYGPAITIRRYDGNYQRVGINSINPQSTLGVIGSCIG